MSKTVKKSAKKKVAPKKKSKVKKAVAKKTGAKKPAKKSAAKKVVKKKVNAKKAAPKRKTGKKVVVKRAAPKKTVKKVAVKKQATKKAIVKKTLALKTTKDSIGETIREKKSSVKLEGGIIVKEVVAKKSTAPSKPRSPLLNTIIEGLEERKAKNIVVLDLNKINNRSFDYFVIADADSSTHVEAIASSVEEEVKKKTGERPYHSEGWQNAEWILLDYIDVVVHIFQKPIRDFYNIEDLWADAEIQKIN